MKKLLSCCFSFLLITSYSIAQTDAGSGIAPLLTSGVTTTGTVANSTLDAGTAANLNACNPGTELYDVWYRFVAQSTNPTIYLTNKGANFTNPALQVSASCTDGSIACGTTSVNPTGLTIGSTYYLRVYSTALAPIPTTAANFDITIVDLPANDACSGTVPMLTSGVTISGSVGNATLDGPAALNACNPGTELYDVWYQFIAQSTNPTIYLTNIGTAFTNTGIQVATSCTAGSIACGTTSVNPTGLTIGSVYYIRVFSTAASIPTINSGFNITVVDVPANNNCGGTVPLLTSGITVTGSVANATLDGPAALNACNAGTELYDVWYRFTATSTNPTIYLTNLGANFTSPAIQVATSCTAGSIACGTTSVNPTVVAGTTYYIRVFSTAASIPNTNAGFDITVIDRPLNDLAANAIVLTPTPGYEMNVSQKVNQSIALSTYTPAAGLTSGTCANVNALDVWYKFVANDISHIILLSNLGSSWSGNQRIQVYTNTVPADGSGTWTSIGCTNSSLLTVTTTVGTTYFVRIHNNDAAAAATASLNWDFDICINKSVVSASRMKEVFSRTILSAAGLMNNPWEVIYGPDNNLWVTDSKNYRVYKIDPGTGAKTTVLDIGNAGTDPNKCLYNNVTVSYQGGLAGMALHPNFMDPIPANKKNWVYLSYGYSQPSPPNGFITRLIRYTYNEVTQLLEQPTLICDSIPGSNDHNSQRMIIAPESVGGPDFLFYACGDMGAGQGTNPTRPQKAQNPNSYEGKILRFNLDEDTDPVQMPTTMNYDRWIPNDNPYNTILAKQSAVWSIGIRNNQGFAYDAVSGLLYGTSHGAYSDDELNILRRFRNYGHPLILGYVDGNYDGTTTATTATSYSAGSPWGSAVQGNSTCVAIGSEYDRRTQINAMGYGAYTDPLFSAYAGPATGTTSVKYIWSQSTTPNNSLWPSEAWSGLDLYTNKLIPGWKQSLVASGLKWGRLLRLKLGASGTTTLPSNLSENNEKDTVLYFQSSNRYRDIAFGPNGKDIYILMDNSASSVATDGNPPVTPACAGCLIKYSFLGYAPDVTGLSTIPKSIDVTTPVVNNTCTAGTTITIDATNNNYWVPITGPDGNIMAEINAMGQNLGVVTSSFYKKAPGAIRVKNGVHYLDRNITITPAVTTFATPVKIRLYISKGEFDDLDADGLSGVSSITDLKILKNNDACGSAITNSTTLFTPTNTLVADLTHGTSGYVLQTAVPGFSSFYFATANITLPLDLITFTGSLQNDKSTLLKWKTENEINTSHFIVERSTDAVNFTNIGTVAAAGNNSGSKNYSFVDNDAINQQSLVLFYRLKMTDVNGEFKYSNVISVSFADITGAVSVAPNPVTHEAKITIIAPADGRVQYKLIDNSGRTIFEKGLQVRKGTTNNINLEMDKLSSGMYFLNVTGAGINRNVKLQKL